jgi:hypothetical protein
MSVTKLTSLFALTLGMALLATPGKADEPKTANSPSKKVEPAKKIEPLTTTTKKKIEPVITKKKVTKVEPVKKVKPPITKKPVKNVKQTSQNSKTYYRAICTNRSHRFHPWVGTARESRDLALRDARSHAHDYRDHKTSVEEVQVPQYPKHREFPKPLKRDPNKRPPIIVRTGH